MPLSRIAGLCSALLLLPALGARAGNLWETMPAGFRTEAAMRASNGSTVSGVLRIDKESRGELQTSVRFSGLEPRQAYLIRFRVRPTCTVDGPPDSEFVEAPRTRPENLLAHQYPSFLGRFPAFVADDQGQAVASAKIPGYIGIDWISLSVVLYRGDGEPTSGSRVACGRFGTVRVEADR